jgi:hypothetical protein
VRIFALLAHHGTPYSLPDGQADIIDLCLDEPQCAGPRHKPRGVPP